MLSHPLRTLIASLTVLSTCYSFAEVTSGYYREVWVNISVRKVFIPYEPSERISGETILLYTRNAHLVSLPQTEDHHANGPQTSMEFSKKKDLRQQRRSALELRMAKGSAQPFEKEAQDIEQIYSFLQDHANSCPGDRGLAILPKNKVIVKSTELAKTLTTLKPDLVTILFEPRDSQFDEKNWIKILSLIPPEMGCFLVLKNSEKHLSRNVATSRKLEDLIHRNDHQCQVIYSQSPQFDPSFVIESICDRDPRSTMPMYQ